MSRSQGVCGILYEIYRLSNNICFDLEDVVTELQIKNILVEIHIMANQIRKHHNDLFTHGQLVSHVVSWSDYMLQLEEASDKLQLSCTSMKFIGTNRHRRVIRTLIQQTHSILDNINLELQQQKLFAT